MCITMSQAGRFVSWANASPALAQDAIACQIRQCRLMTRRAYALYHSNEMQRDTMSGPYL